MRSQLAEGILDPVFSPTERNQLISRGALRWQLQEELRRTKGELQAANERMLIRTIAAVEQQNKQV